MTPARLVLAALTAAAIACSSDNDTVDVSVSPGPDNSGRGTVSASDALLCQLDGTATTGVCNATLDQGGESLEFVAVPGEGSSFIGWLGDCTGTTTCVLSLLRNHSVQAAFVVNDLVTITNDAGSTGLVQVTSNPAGIDCTLMPGFSSGGGVCEAHFPATTSVTLTATPDQYSSFDHWSGGCTGGTCALTLDGPVTVIANSHGSFPLTVLAGNDNVGSGTITSAPAGISCTVTAAASTGQCTAVFTGGTVVSLLATPAAGSLFLYWLGLEDDRGGCTTDPSCSVSIFGPREIPANFSLAPSVRGAASH